MKGNSRIFPNIASESVAVRIARAITRMTKKFLPFINPICTRRGTWRLRVAPRLINQLLLKEGRLYKRKHLFRASAFVWNVWTLLSAKTDGNTRTIQKSLKNFELNKMKTVSFRYRTYLDIYIKMSLNCCLCCSKMMMIRHAYFLEHGVSKFCDIIASQNRVFFFYWISILLSFATGLSREMYIA